MQAPESIETALVRLMPPGLSEAGQCSINAMLDELAGINPAAAEETAAVVPAPPARRIRRLAPGWIAASGIAAALALVASLRTGPLADDVHLAAVISQQPPVQVGIPASGLVLVGEFDHIEAMTDEGWLADPDGVTMEATRIRVVEGNTFLDEETGVLVQVSEPREEIFLTPITAF